MPKEYGSWSLADLKAELRKRNAKVTGRKAVLVQRLLDYDIMFGGLVNDPVSSYHISVPEIHFFDINSNTVLPSITEEDIKEYSVLGERENLTTSNNMYNENYLLSSRAANLGNYFYVVAVCAAEMRKNVFYNVTLKIQHNTILEAQCECAAGMGPYGQCKHVLVLMYGLVDFTLNKTIKTRASPTSNLQTFHQPPQLYTGMPIRAENLRLKTKDDILKKVTTFDPRGHKLTKEKYTEVFMNLTGNFSGHYQNSKMPIQQLRMPVNKMALYRDHDYFNKTMEEKYISSRSLTVEQRSKLEIETRNKNKLKRERQMRLQSSNFGKICKCLSNQQKLAKSFLKNQEVLTLAMKHGIKYEKYAIEKMSQITGLKIKKCGVFVHEEHQFLASTPDGIFGDHGVAEVKCPFSARNKTISPETVPYLYLCEETGQYKLNQNHDYYFQIQGQMLCTGRKLCYFGIYTISDFYCVEIQRNEYFIQDMLKKLIHFYNKYYKYLFLCKFLYNIRI